MAKQTVFMILSALLLLQGCCGKDPNSSESSEENTGKDKLTNIMLSLFEDLSTYIDFALKESEKLYKDVLADANESGDKTNEEITSNIKTIADIVDKIEKMKTATDKREKWAAGILVLDTKDRFDIEDKEELTDEDKVFSNYFEKHGVEALDKELKTKLKDVFKKIEVKLEHFWDGLNLEEQTDTEYHKFNDWHQKLKAESDPEKQLELMAEIFN